MNQNRRDCLKMSLAATAWPPSPPAPPPPGDRAGCRPRDLFELRTYRPQPGLRPRSWTAIWKRP